MPFTHVVIDDSIHQFADTRGHFKILLEHKADKVVFKAPFHRELIYFPQSDSLADLKIKLIPIGVFLPLFEASNAASSHVKKLIANKEKLDIRNQGHFKYDSYQKLTIGTKNLILVKNNFNRYLRTFGKRLKSYDKPHHFFLAESFSNKNYDNAIDWEEKIDAISASGIDQPELQELYAQSLRFNIYDDFLWVANRPYPNPVAGNPTKRYFFQIQDTAIVNNDTILSIIFYPKQNRKTQKLKGVLQINISQNALLSIWAIPTQENRLNLQLAHSLKPWNGAYVSDETRISLKIWGINAFPRGLDAEMIRYDLDYKRQDSTAHKRYDEDIIKYKSGAFSKNDTYWIKNRTTTFDSIDQNTFDFYDTVGSLNEFKGLVNFGSSLVDGTIPVSFIDFDIRRFIGFNEYEGLRLGFGGRTNQKLSEKWRFGIYGGYGLRDKTFKYGFETGFKPYNNLNLLLKGSDDVRESGAINTFEGLDVPTFTSERLRKYRVSIMDQVRSISIQPSTNAIKFLTLYGGLNISHWEPKYDYTFLPDSASSHYINSFKLGIRYAFGERTYQTTIGKKTFKNPYPILFLQFTRALGGLGSDFTFNKLDIRGKYQKRVLGFGLSNIQVDLGFTKSALPYSQLYVGRGGIKNGAVVFHNSFETMRYNEFLSDRHLSIFYSHNFGPIYVPYLRHFPSIEMLHNFGFGNLRQPNIHGVIEIKTMEKGFFESGAYINDILVIRSAGIKIGLGAGFFYRYGPYQNEKTGDNLVFKFALNLGV